MFYVQYQIQILVENHIVSDLSKLGDLLHKTHQGPSGTKVPRLDMCGSILSCGMITDSAKETGQQKGQWDWGLEVTGKLEGGEVDQNLKKE